MLHRSGDVSFAAIEAELRAFLATRAGRGVAERVGAAIDKEKPGRGALVGGLIGVLLGAAIAPGYDDDV